MCVLRGTFLHLFAGHGSCGAVLSTRPIASWRSAPSRRRSPRVRPSLWPMGWRAFWRGSGLCGPCVVLRGAGLPLAVLCPCGAAVQGGKGEASGRSVNGPGEFPDRLRGNARHGLRSQHATRPISDARRDPRLRHATQARQYHTTFGSKVQQNPMFSGAKRDFQRRSVSATRGSTTREGRGRSGAWSSGCLVLPVSRSGSNGKAPLGPRCR